MVYIMYMYVNKRVELAQRGIAQTEIVCMYVCMYVLLIYYYCYYIITCTLTENARLRTGPSVAGETCPELH